ncbi:FKBP-type peptidyl-prolyl cis-trans isomerase [Ravibacter arvi]|uniref:Peptidyl-prolyl cis-trans isomerase n=1 Tax=Ravibacter arvi TaxID=2051041 RepID=A0ABP8LVL1_9BACT
MTLKATSVVFLFAALALVGCDKYKTKVTESGLKYQLHEHKDGGRQVKVGDVVSFHLVLKNSEDSVLNDTYKSKNPIRMMYQQPEFKGSFEEGLGMLSVGDSATFYVNADSMFAKMHQPLPPIIKKGSDLVFRVKLLNAQTPEEFQKTRAEDVEKQKGLDEEIIKKYLADSSLTGKATRSASGLYYIVTKPGEGAKPAAGDKITVHYKGTLLDGTVFDGSQQPGRDGNPFEFNVGTGMVIPGWDEGLIGMSKGEKGILLIPSALGYGPDGSGPIPPNSVLRFDLELLNVTPQPKAAAPKK